MVIGLVTVGSVFGLALAVAAWVFLGLSWWLALAIWSLGGSVVVLLSALAAAYWPGPERAEVPRIRIRNPEARFAGE